MGSQRVAVACLCLVQFVDVMGVTILVTALPSVLAGLGASEAAASPIVTAYAMCFGGLLLLGARLGDRLGHRRVLLAGVSAFGMAGLCGATSSGVVAVIAARCLQGAAAAVSVPCALRLLADVTADEAARQRAVAAWSAAGAAAGASGFLVGGALTQFFGWRTVFWINVPVAVGLVVALARVLPRRRAARPGGLDLAGAATLTAAVMGLVTGGALLEQPATQPLGAALVLGGALLLGVFILVERRARQPLIAPAAFGDRHLRLGALGSFLNTATISAVTLASLYLQQVAHATPTVAGLTLLPFSLLVIAGAAVAPRALGRWATHAVLAAGLGVIALGDAGLVAVPAAPAVLPISAAVVGFGIGLASVAATTVGTDVPADLSATAAGTVNTAAQLGTALGVTALLLLATGTSGGQVVLARPVLAWACAALLAAAGSLLIATGRLGTRAPAAAREQAHSSRRVADWSG